MTNKQIAASLLELANVYETTPDDAGLKEPSMTIYCLSKADVIRQLKAIGGKFSKKEGYGGDSIYFESSKCPGVSVYVDRSQICRKIPARYECDPLLSPEDEAKIVEASA